MSKSDLDCMFVNVDILYEFSQSHMELLNAISETKHIPRFVLGTFGNFVGAGDPEGTESETRTHHLFSFSVRSLANSL